MLAKPQTFTVICQVVAANDPTLVMIVPTNANMAQQITTANAMRLIGVASVFADRAYKGNGLLRSRQFADALHAQPQMICIYGDYALLIAAVRALS